MAHLRWLDDHGETHALPLGDEDVVLGRNAECDVVIRKAYVSRRHCRIYRTDEGWSVADLGSTSGTFVNRIRVGDGTALNPGDRIQAGAEVMATFESGPPPYRAAIGAIDGGVVPDGGTETGERTGDNARPAGLEEILSEQPIDSNEFMDALRAAKSLDLRKIAEKAAAGGAHLAALVCVSEALRRCQDVPAVCRSSLELAMVASGAGRGVVALRTGKDEDTFERIVERTSSDTGTRRARESAESIRISKTFVDRMVSGKMALSATDASADRSLAGAQSVVSARIRSILAAPIWDGEEILGYLYLDTTDATKLKVFSKDDLNLLVAICHQTGSEISRHRMAVRMRDEEVRRRNLARFVSSDVIKHIEQETTRNQDFSLSAREQDVTVFFADIAGFTAMAERMKTSDVKLLLDDYFDRMTEIVIDRHGGTLDKYIGDSIMALFGAPFSRGNEKDAQAAVAAAVEMQETIDGLRQKRKVYAGVRIRIGINTGRVVAGMLGSQRRLEYSVLGDAVNVASRLESGGEPDRIQIGEATYELVKDAFRCEYAGDRKIKNRDKTVKSWWVLGPR